MRTSAAMTTPLDVRGSGSPRHRLVLLEGGARGAGANVGTHTETA